MVCTFHCFNRCVFILLLSWPAIGLLFLVVLFLICLVTTQILICVNQTIWRLEIILRTIVAAFSRTKYNGRFVKNKRYQETGKEYSTTVQMIVKDEGYFAARAIFDAWLWPPSPPSAPQTHTHTHQQKGHCLPNDHCPSYLQPTQPFFQFSSWRTHKFSYHTIAQK